MPPLRQPRTSTASILSIPSVNTTTATTADGVAEQLDTVTMNLTPLDRSPSPNNSSAAQSIDIVIASPTQAESKGQEETLSDPSVTF
jgi:hypothetical protein